MEWSDRVLESKGDLFRMNWMYLIKCNIILDLRRKHSLISKAFTRYMISEARCLIWWRDSWVKLITHVLFYPEFRQLHRSWSVLIQLSIRLLYRRVAFGKLIIAETVVFVFEMWIDRYVLNRSWEEHRGVDWEIILRICDVLQFTIWQKVF